MNALPNNNTIKKAAASYGLILGVVTIAYSILMLFAGFTNSTFTFWGYQVLMAVSIAYAIKKYKEEINEGYISYGQALKFGIFLSLFSGIIQGFYVYIYYSYLAPEEMTVMVHGMQDVLINMGKSDQEVEIASSMMSPSYYAFVIIIKEIIKGFFFSLIIAGFLKKDKSIFED